MKKVVPPPPPLMLLLILFLAGGAPLLCRALSAPSPHRHPAAPAAAAPNSRRDFLEGSVASAAAAAAIAAAPSLPAYAEQGSAAAAASASTSSSSPLSLPPLGLGAWAWGDSVFWGYDKKNDGELKEVFDYALEKNLAFFDTAELYGLGRSEELLGKFRDEAGSRGDEVIVASKFAALPWRTKREDVVKACKASVKRLGGRPIDLYQIHFPNAWSNEAYWDGLADARDLGLVKAVGVSNYGVDAVRACHARLAERGMELATNQIQMSLLYRHPLENGLIDACRELDVRVLSYSPLALGFLTGKYDKGNLPSGPRAKLGKDLFGAEDGAYEELLATMRDIAGKHDAVPSQVALNWAIAKGTIPIPGARNVRQATQNLAALGWSMSKDEEELLDRASARVKGFITPDKNPFPRQDKDTGLVMYDS